MRVGVRIYVLTAFTIYWIINCGICVSYLAEEKQNGQLNYLLPQETPSPSYKWVKRYRLIKFSRGGLKFEYCHGGV